MSQEEIKPTEASQDDNIVIERVGRNSQVEVKPEEVKTEPTPNDSNKKEAGTENQKPRKNRAKERIEKLSREKRELLKQIDELKSSNATATKADEELNPDEFDNYDDYLEAVEKFEKAEKPAKKEPVSTKQDDDFQELLDEIEVKFDETRDKYEDFDDLLQKSPSDGGPTISQSMVEAMNEEDNSGEIAYALAKDVNNSIRIANLSPLKQTKEIIKLGMSLSKDAVTTEKVTSKKTTSAPEPINALGGGETVQKTLADAGSFSEYEAQRRADNSKTNW